MNDPVARLIDAARDVIEESHMVGKGSSLVGPGPMSRLAKVLLALDAEPTEEEVEEMAKWLANISGNALWGQESRQGKAAFVNMARAVLSRYCGGVKP